GFDRQYKPLFFNYKYVTRPVEKPGTPSEPNHLEFRRVSTIRCEREVTKGLFAFPRGLLFLLIFAHAQHRQKRLLRNVYFPNALHALFALFLLLKQLALAGDIAAIALGEDVF